jgi:hypothetical protein
MRNPWLKKNPWLSMWMSGANAVLGSARARGTAEAKRQAGAMTSNALSQSMRFWTSVMAPPKRKRARKS